MQMVQTTLLSSGVHIGRFVLNEPRRGTALLGGAVVRERLALRVRGTILGAEQKVVPATLAWCCAVNMRHS